MKPIKNIDTLTKFIVSVFMVIVAFLLPTQTAFANGNVHQIKKAKYQHSQQVKQKKAKATKKKYSKKKYGKKKAVKRQSATRAVIRNGGGVASWYGPGFHGRLTASGQRFNQNALTTAHRSLPFGTKLLVTNVNNGKSVEVIVNDRGPFIGNRVLDLSKGAFSRIASTGAGVVKIKYEVLSVGDGKYRRH